jgi:hypothetical protein
MDGTELVAWIGWASTAGAWAYRWYATRPKPVVLPFPTTAGRHRLDTWTAIKMDGRLIQHGRGKVPSRINRGGLVYHFVSVHPSDPTVALYQAES